jgi:hypothetical protein
MFARCTLVLQAILTPHSAFCTHVSACLACLLCLFSLWSMVMQEPPVVCLVGKQLRRVGAWMPLNLHPTRPGLALSTCRRPSRTLQTQPARICWRRQPAGSSPTR